MFDIGFSEIIVCAIVGLVVIGPERLPEAVRTIGLWVGRIKRSLRETREELERQVGMEDVRRQLHTEEMMRTLDDMQEEIDAALNYERMGKNKPVIEHSPDPIHNSDNSNSSDSSSDSYRANSSVENVNSQAVLPHPETAHAGSDVNAKTDIKIPPIKPIEKTETAVVHH